MRALFTLGLLLCAVASNYRTTSADERFTGSQKGEAEGAGQGFYTYTRCEDHMCGEAVPPPVKLYKCSPPPFPSFFTSVVRPEVVKPVAWKGDNGLGSLENL